jgi:hypothetical protein
VAGLLHPVPFREPAPESGPFHVLAVQVIGLGILREHGDHAQGLERSGHEDAVDVILAGIEFLVSRAGLLRKAGLYFQPLLVVHHRVAQVFAGRADVGVDFLILAPGAVDRGGCGVAFRGHDRGLHAGVNGFRVPAFAELMLGREGERDEKEKEGPRDYQFVRFSRDH